MEQLDILTAVRQSPEFAGKAINWVAKLEEQTTGEMTFLVKRKVIKEDHIHYMVRVMLHQTLDLAVGDKVAISGTLPYTIEREDIEPGHINYYVDLDNAEITPITASGSRTVGELTKEEVE
jgi:hypothetical protein